MSAPGPYFAEGTPAMVALETMVDTVGMRNVLYALAHIADAKADHIQASYATSRATDPLARQWSTLATRIDTFAQRMPHGTE